MRDGDALCIECPGQGTQMQTLPEALLDDVLFAPAIWRKSAEGRLTGFNTTELRARFADLPKDLFEETLSLAFSIEARVMATLMEDHANP